MAATGKLVGLSAALLQQMQDAVSQCIIAGAERGLSYSINGRSHTFPSLSEAQDALLEINYALDQLTGARSTVVTANFNRALARR